MKHAPFSGIDILAPGDPLSIDNGAFTGSDRETIDGLLRIGAKTHRHTGLAGLSNPAVAPLASIIASGGTIPADLAISLGYTFEDAQTGETMLSPVSVVSTPPPVGAPQTPPVAAVVTTSGELLVNTYYYAVTFTDGEGGETPLGPAASAQRPPGFPHGEVQLSGLTNGLEAAGATGWRLYRAIGGNAYNLLASGGASEDTFTDDGTHSLDCSTHPPAGEENTTTGISTLTVTLPSGLAPDVVAINLYASIGGDFSGGSFLAAFPAASAGAVSSFSSLSLGSLSPPVVNLSIGGAHQIDPDTELLDYHWLRPVATKADLPPGEEGDVRITLDTHKAYIYTKEWELWDQGGGEGGGALDVFLEGAKGAETIIIENAFEDGELDTNWEMEEGAVPSEFWEETEGHLVKIGGGAMAFRKGTEGLDAKITSKIAGAESFACIDLHVLRADVGGGKGFLVAGYSGGFGHGNPAKIGVFIQGEEDWTLASESFTEPEAGFYWVVTSIKGTVVRVEFWDEDPSVGVEPLNVVEVDIADEELEAPLVTREAFFTAGLFGLQFVGAPGGTISEWNAEVAAPPSPDFVPAAEFIEIRDGDEVGVESATSGSKTGALVTVPGRAGAMGYVNCGEVTTKARPDFDGVTWLVTGGKGEPVHMADGDILIEVNGILAKQFVKVGGSLIEV